MKKLKFIVITRSGITKKFSHIRDATNYAAKFKGASIFRKNKKSFTQF